MILVMEKMFEEGLDLEGVAKLNETAIEELREMYSNDTHHT